jgi:menaquinol-cytochrome c reductase iron-sulfur subunit
MSDINHKDLSRRDFIKATMAIVGGFIGAVIAIPAIAYLISPALRNDEENAWINLGALEKYPLKIPTLFEFARTKVNGWERTGMTYGVFVVRPDEQTVRIFSNICTHLGCHITWRPNIQNYVSPCHDGHFDILGKVVSGPPPRPLDEFHTKIESGNLYIQLPAFRRTS